MLPVILHHLPGSEATTREVLWGPLTPTSTHTPNPPCHQQSEIKSVTFSETHSSALSNHIFYQETDTVSMHLMPVSSLPQYKAPNGWTLPSRPSQLVIIPPNTGLLSGVLVTLKAKGVFWLGAPRLF